MKKADDEQQSAFARAASGQDVDPRCIPIELNEEPPVGVAISTPKYTDVEQATWRQLCERQNALLPGRACQEFHEGQERLQLSATQIPSLRDLSAHLQEASGWQVARIPGLLHEEDFFRLLARATFPSTDYIRTPEELDYTPAPDMFHDIYGHMPLITIPSFANFYKLFGEIAGRAQGKNRRRLERIYWFTVEFGLLRTTEGTRIYGAGILSSPKEILHALSDKVTRLPFDPAVVCETEYDVWHMQDKLFVIESFEKLENDFSAWVEEMEMR
jgi:phenylalanine-4-hydroxylase